MLYIYIYVCIHVYMYMHICIYSHCYTQTLLGSQALIRVPRLLCGQWLIGFCLSLQFCCVPWTCRHLTSNIYWDCIRNLQGIYIYIYIWVGEAAASPQALNDGQGLWEFLLNKTCVLKKQQQKRKHYVRCSFVSI